LISIIRRLDEKQRQDRMAKLQQRVPSFEPELMERVSTIIDDVRKRGDEALIEYTAEFDRVELRRENLRVDEELLHRLAKRVDPAVLQALKEAIGNVRHFHWRQLQDSWQINPAPGITLGQRVNAIENVGLYVPGGTAAYPSSVVMNVVPAQVAGVNRLAVTTPPRTFAEAPIVAAALIELGVKEIYSVGGPQAIAALAYGTETIPRVDKITGPGNKYVAAAKKLVFGVVGIDSLAGPSEVVIIADGTARADFIAADLLAQAEHDNDAAALLITTSDQLAEAVADEVSRQIKALARREIAQQSLNNYGAVLVVDSIEQACDIVNELAPEHVELMTGDDEHVAVNIRQAGAIFFGSYTPEAVGDYFAGPNHVLPTGRTARFSSALGVYDFMKRTSLIRYSEDAMRAAASSIAKLAEIEGLQAHAYSARIRM